MRSWEEARKEHLAVVLEKYNIDNILGIFAYGSQNYNAQSADSDWDTKVIYIPSFDELVLSSIVNETIELPNGEHCVIKDIREMIKNYLKQNINFTETLFTEYKWINPSYRTEWEELKSYRSDIVYYSPYATVKSISGQILHTLHQDPSNEKKIANAYRLTLFLTKYLDGFPYNDCIKLSSAERNEFRLLKHCRHSEAYKQAYVSTIKQTLEKLNDIPFKENEYDKQRIKSSLKALQIKIFKRQVVKALLTS